mmetsp:Transcript_115486/g.331471  ORF Transcript_115486/g.331471 Transcript_115486/m.331471 type:complete len:728 (-) Transcript_115486:165-2348(-)
MFTEDAPFVRTASPSSMSSPDSLKACESIATPQRLVLHHGGAALSAEAACRLRAELLDNIARLHEVVLQRLTGEEPQLSPAPAPQDSGETTAAGAPLAAASGPALPRGSPSWPVAMRDLEVSHDWPLEIRILAPRQPPGARRARHPRGLSEPALPEWSENSDVAKSEEGVEQSDTLSATRSPRGRYSSSRSHSPRGRNSRSSRASSALASVQSIAGMGRPPGNLASEADVECSADGDAGRRVSREDRPQRFGRRHSTLSSMMGGVTRLGSVMFESEKRLKRIAEANSRFKRSANMVMNSTKLSCARRFIQSPAFEMAVALLCAFSAALVGIEIQWQASHLGQPVPGAFYALQQTCAAIFLAEVLMRIWAFGFCSMYCKNGFGWDHFDLVVVASIFFEVAVDVATHFASAETARDNPAAVGQSRIVRALRIAKMARAIRIHRILRFVAPLRTLVFSIMATLKSLFWSMILLLMMMYIVSTLITQRALEQLAEGTELGQDSRLCEYWCSLDASMLTLFQSIAGGLSWREPLEPLFEEALLTPWIFVAYISIVYFAVLNVVTAVFCTRAIETTQKNPELGASATIIDRQMYAKNLSAFFAAMDQDNRGVITLADFERAVNDHVLSAHLATLELDTTDAWSLFKLIDADMSGFISREEFISGCESIKGGARGIQLAQMSLEQRRLAQAMLKFMTEVDQRLTTISSRLTEVSACRRINATPSARPRGGTLER